MHLTREDVVELPVHDDHGCGWGSRWSRSHSWTQGSTCSDAALSRACAERPLCQEHARTMLTRPPA